MWISRRAWAMWISRRAFEKADRRGSERRRSGPVAARARFDRRRGRIVVLLGSGLEIAFRPQDVQGLATGMAPEPPPGLALSLALRPGASGEDLREIEITPSGLGLHFPKLDAHVYLPTLIEGFLNTRRWTAAETASRGGESTSAAKAEAARSNGRKGGRPRTGRRPRVYIAF